MLIPIVRGSARLLLAITLFFPFQSASVRDTKIISTMDQLIVGMRLRTLGARGSGALGAVLASPSLPAVHAGGVKGATNNMVSHSGQVLDPATTDKDHRMLLEGRTPIQKASIPKRFHLR